MQLRKNRQLPDGPLADPGVRFSRTGLLRETRTAWEWLSVSRAFTTTPSHFASRELDTFYGESSSPLVGAFSGFALCTPLRPVNGSPALRLLWVCLTPLTWPPLLVFAYEQPSSPRVPRWAS